MLCNHSIILLLIINIFVWCMWISHLLWTNLQTDVHSYTAELKQLHQLLEVRALKKRIWPTKKLTFQKRWENYYDLHAWQYIRLSVTTFYLDQIINNNRLIHIHNRLIISWITYNNTCVLQFPYFLKTKRAEIGCS